MIQPKTTSPSSGRQVMVQRMGFSLLSLLALLTVLPILVLIIYIAVQGLPAVSLEFVIGFPRDGMRAGGIWPAIVGTFYLTLGTAIFSVPLGVGAAIYLSEYASDNAWTRLIRHYNTSLARHISNSIVSKKRAQRWRAHWISSPRSRTPTPISA